MRARKVRAAGPAIVTRILAPVLVAEVTLALFDELIAVCDDALGAVCDDALGACRGLRFHSD